MSDLFAEKAKDWDSSEQKTGMAEAIGAAIFEHVELDESMTVLDFGAGTGLVSAQLAPRVKHIVAIDTSQAMLDKLAQKPELKGKVETLNRDIIERPLDTRFDLIVSAMAMHHVEDTTRLMQRFHEHLADSGLVALCDLDDEDGNFHTPGTEGVYHPGFERGALESLMKQHGFSEIEFRTVYLYQRESGAYPIFMVTARKA